MPPTQRSLARIYEFNTDDWSHWVRRLFGEDPVPPYINFPQFEPINKLLWVFNTLTETKEPAATQALARLVSATSSLLESINPVAENADLIYNVIYFIDSCAPMDCRRQAERVIRSERYLDVRYGGVSLHYFLVKAYIPIETSDLPLKSYLYRRAVQNMTDMAGHEYFFYVSAKYFFEKESIRAGFRYIRRLFSQPLSTRIAFYLSHAILDMVLTYKDFEDFLVWWIKRTEEYLKEENAGNYELFLEQFRSIFTEAFLKQREFITTVKNKMFIDYPQRLFYDLVNYMTATEQTRLYSYSYREVTALEVDRLQERVDPLLEAEYGRVEEVFRLIERLKEKFIGQNTQAAANYLLNYYIL